MEKMREKVTFKWKRTRYINGKPYYLICYGSLEDGKTHEGYGSYNKEIRDQWFEEMLIVHKCSTLKLK